MPPRAIRSAGIVGTGMYLPDKEIANRELGRMMNYDVEGWLQDKGIKVRYKADPDENTSDMAVKASRKALKDANITPKELDLIILSTDTPDYISPPTSAIIQHKLGANNAGCFDLNAACTDETIALAIGSQYLMLDNKIKNVLVTGAYGMTKWLDWSDYSRSASKVLGMLFSDGGGAVILSVSSEPGYLTSVNRAEGDYWDAYGIYLGTANLPTEEMIRDKKHYLRFHQNEHHVPSDFNQKRWPLLIEETVKKAGFEVGDLDMVLFNQVNLSEIKETMKRLSLPLSKTHWVMDKFGYSGSASILMALDDAKRQKKIQTGDLVAFCTSGAGFVMSTALFKWI